MNKLLAYPYIKETVNKNRLTSPMSTGANATVPKVRRLTLSMEVYLYSKDLKDIKDYATTGGAGATVP
jgi:hypothetical protein